MYSGNYSDQKFENSKNAKMCLNKSSQVTLNFYKVAQILLNVECESITLYSSHWLSFLLKQVQIILAVQSQLQQHVINLSYHTANSEESFNLKQCRDDLKAQSKMQILQFFKHIIRRQHSFPIYFADLPLLGGSLNSDRFMSLQGDVNINYI